MLVIPTVAPAQSIIPPPQLFPTNIFQQTGIAEGAGENSVTFSFDVPAGRVLVVENISARVVVPKGQIVTAQVNCNGASQGGQFASASQFLLFQTTTIEGQDRYLAQQLARCYVAGTTSQSELTAVVQRHPSDVGLFESVDVSVSGFLMDTP
ncbi:MAG TPA: hypothetical protein VLG10_02880 [Methylomirabilota bacterium]|nr:hypothetical protein [Methylomirabilota bacterium]